MFVPLSYPPGHAQADFGEAVVTRADRTPFAPGWSDLQVSHETIYQFVYSKDGHAIESSCDW